MKAASSFFVGAPFALTASRDSGRFWSGRQDVRERLERLRRAYLTRPDSSLDLVWANLGAGKTHVLFHMMYLLEQAEDPKPITIYVEMPNQPRFLDLYSRVMSQLPLERVAPILIDAPGPEGEYLRSAARALVYGGPSEKHLAQSWITAGRPMLRELRNATGIGERIESDGFSCQILTQVVRSLAAAGVRLVLLVDEFQRVGAARQREALLSGIRSIFTHNPSHFSLVLAVASRVQKNAIDLLPHELRTLMGMRPAVSLPEMNEAEAVEFLLGRLEHFRPQGYSGDPVAPFGLDCLKTIVSQLAAAGSQRMIPRTFLQVASVVYDEALDRGVSEMSVEATRSVLKELALDETQESE